MIVGVVGVVDGMHHHVGVAVDEVVELAGPHEEGGHELARVDRLLFVRDDAGLGQGHHAVGEHLRVDAQVLLALQEEQHGVRDGADAHLERRAVLDEFRHILADGLLEIADDGRLELDEGLVLLDDAVDLVEVDLRPEGAGHVLVHLGDGHAVGARRGQRVVHGDAEAAEAFGIGRRDLHQRHVDGQDPPAEQARDLGEKAGGVQRAPLGDGLARRGPDKQRVVPEAPLHSGLGVLGGPHGHHVDDLHALELRCAGHEGLHQRGRLAAGMAHDDAVVVLNLLDCLGGTS